MRNKDLTKIPTWKIKEILEEPYCRGIDGKDYGPYKEELESILWDRVAKQDLKLFKKRVREYGKSK